MFGDDEVKELRLQEEKRGSKRKKFDPAAKRRRAEERRNYGTLLEIATERQFSDAIKTSFGILPGSSRYDQMIQAWREKRAEDQRRSWKRL